MARVLHLWGGGGFLCFTGEGLRGSDSAVIPSVTKNAGTWMGVLPRQLYGEAVENDIPRCRPDCIRSGGIRKQNRSLRTTAILTKPLYIRKYPSTLRKLSGTRKRQNQISNGRCQKDSMENKYS